MHKPECYLENETHKILWDFEMKMDHPIQFRRTDKALIQKKKKNCHLEDGADHTV